MFTRPVFPQVVVDLTHQAHARLCEGGWLPDTARGEAVPCPVCKADLLARRQAALDRSRREYGRPAVPEQGALSVTGVA